MYIYYFDIVACRNANGLNTAAANSMVHDEQRRRRTKKAGNKKYLFLYVVIIYIKLCIYKFVHASNHYNVYIVALVGVNVVFWLLAFSLIKVKKKIMRKSKTTTMMKRKKDEKKGYHDEMNKQTNKRSR